MRTAPEIIIVDDDPDEVLFLQEVLHCHGFDGVRFFQDPRQVLSLLEESEDPDLPKVIITDLNMPRISGLDLIRYVKACSRYRNIAVLVMSTSSLVREIDLCLALGAEAYLPKPSLAAEYDRLVAKIEEYCR